MSKKKTNPRRIPVTQADIKKAKQQAEEKAVNTVWSIFFTVLRDKENAELEDLRRIWRECEDLSDSIAKGYCSVADLRTILKEEAGVNIV